MHCTAEYKGSYAMGDLLLQHGTDVFPSTLDMDVCLERPAFERRVEAVDPQGRVLQLGEDLMSTLLPRPTLRPDVEGKVVA